MNPLDLVATLWSGPISGQPLAPGSPRALLGLWQDLTPTVGGGFAALHLDPKAASTAIAKGTLFTCLVAGPELPPAACAGLAQVIALLYWMDQRLDQGETTWAGDEFQALAQTWLAQAAALCWPVDAALVTGQLRDCLTAQGQRVRRAPAPSPDWVRLMLSSTGLEAVSALVYAACRRESGVGPALETLRHDHAQALHQLARSCQGVVRLLDDLGDREQDAATGADNLFLVGPDHVRLFLAEAELPASWWTLWEEAEALVEVGLARLRQWLNEPDTQALPALYRTLVRRLLEIAGIHRRGDTQLDHLADD